MNPLRILIVDDERLSRGRLRRLLHNDPEVTVVAECATAQQAQDFLAEHPADLLFLDIDMPGMDGFALLEALGPRRPAFVVFLTAHSQFALRAFDVQAFDYLLKPYEEQRLLASVRRAKAQQAAPPRAHYRDRLAVRAGESFVLLRTDQVDWIEAADNYVAVHCGPQTHTLRETMNAIQKTLDPSRFLRIHRSAIVNLDRIQALEPWFRGDYRVLLSTGALLTLSRSYRHNLQDRVMNL